MLCALPTRWAVGSGKKKKKKKEGYKKGGKGGGGARGLQKK
jgi:hypothetical protein